MSGWGKGMINNDIGWGRGATNDIFWGIYQRDSHSGDTVIYKTVTDIFKDRVEDDSGTFEAFDCVVTFVQNL